MEKPPEKLCKKCGQCCKSQSCKYLRYDNACMIYSDRPEECKFYPIDIWKELPKGCGYEGWIFQQREKIKQQVRFQKEKILSLNVKMKYATLAQKTLLRDELREIQNFIDTYSIQGSKDW